MLSKRKIFVFALAIGLVLSVVLSICNFDARCNTIRQNVVRLHILANSNTEADQNLKLKVRNEILKSSEQVFENAENFEQALDSAKQNLELFQNSAQRVVEQNGYDYKVNTYIGKSFFTTRHYENFTLPAGVYEAVKVEIGEAKGKNWWCVMFPAVCLPSASGDGFGKVLGETETEIVSNSGKYKCRFKVVELYEKTKHFFNSKIKF